MEIVNNQNVSINGNDLVLDDIKIMACSPPSLNLYFNLPTLLEATSVCPTANLNLETRASALLSAFYGGAPRFLYQWTRTPANNNSWQNLAAPGTLQTYTITNVGSTPPFSVLPDGGKVYFRIIAATATTFTTNTNFLSPNFANPNDPCKSYSVSDIIEATVTCPLPVNLLYFEGWKNEEVNQLKWMTGSETQNDYFDLERSEDGSNFSFLGTVEGNGTSQLVNSYSFNDVQPSNGINYYRLKQVDYNGEYAYSKIIAIDNGSSKATLDIFPNPNNGNFDIHISKAGMDQEYKLELLDVQGKVVYTSNGTKPFESIQITSLTSGIYIVRLASSSQVITKKLLVY